MTFGLTAAPEVPRDAVLGFAETAEDVDALLAEGRAPIDRVVALDPDAAFALAEAGHAYAKLEDGYDERNLRALASAALDDQQRWAEWVDASLQQRVEAFGESRFAPARSYLYWLKIAFDSVRLRHYTVTAALRSWTPRRVVVPRVSDADAVFDADLSFRASLYPVVVPRVAAELRIPCETFAPRPIATAAKKRAALWPLLRSAPRRAARRIRSAVADQARGRSDAGTMVVSAQFDWRAALASSRPRAVGSWEKTVDAVRASLDPDAVRAATAWMAQAWPAMSGAAEWCAPLGEGRTLWDVVEPRIRFWWHTLVPEQWAAYDAVRRRHALRPPTAVAAAVLDDHVERGVFSGFRSLGARACLYQHGGFVGWCECLPWDCSDLWQADVELTYGDGVTSYFASRRARYDGSRAMPISVGSARLDALPRFRRQPGDRSSRPRVLLVPNVIPRNNRYLDYGNLPDVTEGEVQAAMVSIAREHPAYDFVLKPFPDQTDTPAVRLAGRAGSNCRVEGTPLPALMAGAHVIVLSFPSTALLEALVTDSRVVVFADARSIHLFDSAAAALRRRASVAETLPEFLSSIRAALAADDDPPDDDTFLRLYGTHLNDGRSADRAFAALSGSKPLCAPPPAASASRA